MNDVLLFLPQNSLEQRKAQEKIIVEDMHSTVHILSIPGRLIEEAFKHLYQGPYCENVNKLLPTNSPLILNCDQIEKSYIELGKKIEVLVPNVVTELWNKTLEKLKNCQNTLKKKWFEEFNISYDSSNRFFESMG